MTRSVGFHLVITTPKAGAKLLEYDHDVWINRLQ